MSLCACECGEEVKEGNKYIWGHNACKKSSFHPILNEKILCACGCGKEIENPIYNYRLKQYQRYIYGHNNVKNNPGFKEGHNPWNKCYGDYMKGVENHFYGKHHTEESKRKNREKHLGKSASKETKKRMHDAHSGKNNHMYGKPCPMYAGASKGNYYDSPLQGKVYLRSSYEIAYAQYLDEHKILWYYEIERFELSEGITYTPDFFLPQFDKFIEIKGYMDNRAKIRIEKFKEEYPWNLEVLRKMDLIKLGVKI